MESAVGEKPSGLLLFAMLAEHVMPAREVGPSSSETFASSSPTPPSSASITQACSETTTSNRSPMAPQPMLGFLAEQVERITPATLIRPIPLAPVILMGLAVCFGRVMTVVDVTALLLPTPTFKPTQKPSHFVIVAEQPGSPQQVALAVGASAGICLAAQPIEGAHQPVRGIRQILQSERHGIWLLDLPMLLTMVWQTCAASSRKIALQRSLP